METQKITVEAIINANKNKVWDYYTKPEHITRWNYADPSWHCPSASNEMKVGGIYSARMEARDGTHGFDFVATYTAISPLENFTYEFGGRYAMVLFAAQDAQTKVTITFDPETQNPPELQQKGWQAILNNFKDYTEAN